MFGTMNKDIINNEISNLSGTRCNDVDIKTAQAKIQMIISGNRSTEDNNASVIKVKSSLKQSRKDFKSNQPVRNTILSLDPYMHI
jgi:hypothetical protein